MEGKGQLRKEEGKEILKGYTKEKSMVRREVLMTVECVSIS